MIWAQNQAQTSAEAAVVPCAFINRGYRGKVHMGPWVSVPTVVAARAHHRPTLHLLRERWAGSLLTMSGRYAFSLPEPRQRDGWFRIGSIDITTTALIVGLGVLSMLLYAIDPTTAFRGAFISELVRQGQVWRTVTWPLINPPVSVWALVSLAVFWFLGHLVEDEIGRKPMAVLIAAMTVVPTVVVTLLNVANEAGTGGWSAYSYSVSFLSLGMITIFGIERPNLKFFFGIPAWVIAAAYVFIEILSNVADRAWAQLILVLLVIAVGCIGARQRGMLDLLTFIPRFKALAGPTRSPYGEVRSQQAPRSKRFGKGRKKGPSGPGTVVAGPWGEPTGPTLLEQAELDVLLDKISESGIDSLTKQEKDRLNHLSKRMRGN